MTEPVINEHAYKAGPHSKLVELRLVVMLDMVPGWGHQIEDHIALIHRSNPYVQSIEVIDRPNPFSPVEVISND
jgi:hypothetical protein